jgi:hypothetical protein
MYKMFVRLSLAKPYQDSVSSASGKPRLTYFYKCPDYQIYKNTL